MLYMSQFRNVRKPMTHTEWDDNNKMSFSADNSKIISNNADTVWVWDIASKTLISKTCGYVIGPSFRDNSNAELFTA